MIPETRKRKQELTDAIRARLGSYEVDTFMGLIQLMLDDAKDRFISADPTQLAVLQQEARTYDELIRMVTRPSIKSLTTKE
jgi:hypothetical protein